MRPILEVAKDKLGIPAKDLIPYGHYKAKVSLDYIAGLADKPDGKLILVTAITPTPAGEGKTRTTVGLGDALNVIGKRAIVCIREPSLGPLLRGQGRGGRRRLCPGRADGGHQPAFHRRLPCDRRCQQSARDDRQPGLSAAAPHPHPPHRRPRRSSKTTTAFSADIVTAGGAANGFPREAGFDITVASEVMAIFCLASDLDDLQRRLGQIRSARRATRKPSPPRICRRPARWRHCSRMRSRRT